MGEHVESQGGGPVDPIGKFTQKPPQELIEETRQRILGRVIDQTDSDTLRTLLPFVPAQTIVRAAREVYSPHEYHGSRPTERELKTFALNAGFETCMSSVPGITELLGESDTNWLRENVKLAEQSHAFDASFAADDTELSHQVRTGLEMFEAITSRLIGPIRDHIRQDIQSEAALMNELAFMDAYTEINSSQRSRHMRFTSPGDEAITTYLRDHENCVVVDLGAGRPGLDTMDRHAGSHSIVLVDNQTYVCRFLESAAKLTESGNVQVLEQDATIQAVNSGEADVIRASAFVHDLEPDDSDRLAESAATALKSGGLFVSEDLFKQEYQYAGSGKNEDNTERMQAFRESLERHGFTCEPLILRDTGTDSITGSKVTTEYLIIKAIRK